MAAKFVRVKKIILPLITVVILASQLSGCAIVSQKDAEDILQSGTEVEIEIADTDIDTKDTVGGYEIEIPDSSLDEDGDIGVIEQADYTSVFEQIYADAQMIGGKLEEQAVFELEKGMAGDKVSQGDLPSAGLDLYIEWRLENHPIENYDTTMGSTGIGEELMNPDDILIDTQQPEDTTQPVDNTQPPAQQPTQQQPTQSTQQPVQQQPSQGTGGSSNTDGLRPHILRG